MNEFPHLSKLAKPLDTLKNELLKSGQLPARLGTAPSEVHLFAVSNDEKSYDLRLSISAPGAKLSEDDAEKFSEEIEERFEELMVAQYGEDEGEDLALALIFVNVVLNGEEVY
jgi:hypothetical protein